MGRGKVKLELIEKPSGRRATLRKQGGDLRKKASELATLCGVDVCVVAYGEGEPSSQAPEVVWPEDPEQAARVLERFKSVPEVDRCKKMLDGASLLRERVAKLQQQVRRAESDNRERETKLLLHDAMVGRRPGLEGLTVQQLVSLGWMVEDRVNKIRERLAQLRGQQGFDPPPPYATTGAGVDSPPPPQGWLMDLLKAGCDEDSIPYYRDPGNGGGNVGAGGSTMTMQLPWACPGTSSPPV